MKVQRLVSARHVVSFQSTELNSIICSVYHVEQHIFMSVHLPVSPSRRPMRPGSLKDWGSWQVVKPEVKSKSGILAGEPPGCALKRIDGLLEP